MNELNDLAIKFERDVAKRDNVSFLADLVEVLYTRNTFAPKEKDQLKEVILNRIYELSPYPNMKELIWSFNSNSYDEIDYLHIMRLGGEIEKVEHIDQVMAIKTNILKSKESWKVKVYLCDKAYQRIKELTDS